MGRCRILGPRYDTQMDAVGFGVDAQIGVFDTEKLRDYLINGAF